MAEPAHQPTQTIRQLRQERGWSQLELALQLDLAQSSIAQWEQGHRQPSPANRQRLADLFGVSVEAISVGPAEQAPG